MNRPVQVRRVGGATIAPWLDDVARLRHAVFRDWPYLYDGDTQQTAHQYGPKVTPHIFVFDKERKLRYEGRIDDNQRESLVKIRDARNAWDAVPANAVRVGGGIAPPQKTKSKVTAGFWPNTPKRHRKMPSFNAWKDLPLNAPNNSTP